MEATIDYTDKVEKALESIRPFLIEDGGNVELLEITDDGVVKIEFKGACQSCSMSTTTFKAGVEDAILRAVPEIKEVVAVNL